MARPVKISTITKLFQLANRLENRADERRKKAKELNEKFRKQHARKSR